MDYSNLISDIIRKSPAAVEQFYNLTYAKGFSIAVQMMKNEQDAMDAMQESYIKALNNIYRVQDTTRLPAWFNAIVNRTCLDMLRKRKTVSFADMTGDDTELEFEDTLVNDNREFVPEESLDYAQTKEVFKNILANLPDEQRTCVLMYYYEEFSVNEIAEQVGCSTGTVKSRLNYARKKIKEEVLDMEKKGAIIRVLPIPFIVWLLAQTETTYAMPLAMQTAVGSQIGLRAGKMAGAGMNAGQTAAKYAAKQAAVTAGKAGAKAGMSGGLKALLICGAVGVAGAAGVGTSLLVHHQIQQRTAVVEEADNTVENVTPIETPVGIETPAPTATETPTPTPPPLSSYRASYEKVLDDTAEQSRAEAKQSDAGSTEGGVNYGLYDLNGDGILEMVVKDVYADMEYQASFVWYTVDPTTYAAIRLGDTPGKHSEIYANPDGKGVLMCRAMKGYVSVRRVTYENETLVEDYLYTEPNTQGDYQTDRKGDYQTDRKLVMADYADRTIFNDDTDKVVYRYTCAELNADMTLWKKVQLNFP